MEDSTNKSDKILPLKKTLILRKSSLVSDIILNKFAIDYPSELNVAQLEVVESIYGPILVIAGAGTGKTRTIVYRVAKMIESGMNPENILLLTFTRKSAQEMIRRASTLIGTDAERICGGTFHSYANLFLRQFSAHLGYQNSFTILDQSDSEDVINLIRNRFELNTKNRRFPRKQTLFAMISSSINRLKNLDEVLDEDYHQYKNELESIQMIAKEYIRYKKEKNIMDYDDLLTNTIQLLEKFPEVRKNQSNIYKYILVDEYQDTNKLQHAIVSLLGKEHKNVMVVGDDAQSIYSFRGANFKNIFEFPEIFPDTKIIKLEENYRSTQTILDCTNNIIHSASIKYEKNLFTRKIGGDLPMLISTPNELIQSQLIAQQVLKLREDGLELNDIAILFRSSFHSFDLEVELNKCNIPYLKYGGFKFIETSHVKDLIAYLKIIFNPKDIVSWNRVLLLINGVGPRTVNKVVEALELNEISLNELSIDKIVKLTNENVGLLFDILCKIKNDKTSILQKVKIIVDYYSPIMKAKYDDYQKRIKDLTVFEDIASRYKSLNSLLTDMALDPPTQSVTEFDDKSEKEKLILSTIHSAKGLEWNTVFVIWTLDGYFPSFHSAKSIEAMEEERRLMYVAATRAKERLIFIYPTNIFERESGTVLSQVSKFLSNISEEILEKYTVEVE
jgi:DNA helicase-2/ATP-dependent DNA helicase PcrA